MELNQPDKQANHLIIEKPNISTSKKQIVRSNNAQIMLISIICELNKSALSGASPPTSTKCEQGLCVRLSVVFLSRRIAAGATVFGGGLAAS